MTDEILDVYEQCVKVHWLKEQILASEEAPDHEGYKELSAQYDKACEELSELYGYAHHQGVPEGLLEALICKYTPHLKVKEAT